MGFGFNLLFVFILPIIIIVLSVLLFFGKKIPLKLFGLIGLATFSLMLLAISIRWLNEKKVLRKADYYGEYIIDRTYFPGKQADWQYQHFRFEIKSNDSIYFYVMDNGERLKTYKGTITTTKPYNSERLVINMEQYTHHIVASNPTVYRGAWDFCLVFNSPMFSNVFFKKGQWKPI